MIGNKNVLKVQETDNMIKPHNMFLDKAKHKQDQKTTKNEKKTKPKQHAVK